MNGLYANEALQDRQTDGRHSQVFVLREERLEWMNHHDTAKKKKNVQRIRVTRVMDTM